MRNAGLDEAQAGIKITGRNINNFRYADAPGSAVSGWVEGEDAGTQTLNPRPLCPLSQCLPAC